MTGHITTSGARLLGDIMRMERVLTAWVGGKQTIEIAKQEGLSRNVVINIVEAARRNGDERAIRRTKLKEEVNASSYWSPVQMRKMDADFKQALLSAIASGHETKEKRKLELGVYRAPGRAILAREAMV